MISAKTLVENGKEWWQRWKPAWKIRWKLSNYKFNFDLHRANGLWFWGILIIFAWSSVYMNLWDTVYTWTTRSLFDYKTPWTELQTLDQPIARSHLNWQQAQTTGEKLMAEQAHRYGFIVKHPVKLQLDRKTATYTWQVHSDREIDNRSHRTTTQVIFDANNGELKLLLLPDGQYTGNTITNWLYALHMANVFGLPYRIFVCILGLIIVMLSVTAIIIWLKKRQARISVRSS